MPVHHMVLLRFKPNTPQATIDKLFAALARLQSVIDGMTH
jgi:hypothetical protein